MVSKFPLHERKGHVGMEVHALVKKIVRELL